MACSYLHLAHHDIMMLPQMNMGTLGGLDSFGSQDAWLNLLLHLTQRLVMK